MLRPYQRRLLFSYLANAAGRLDRRDPAAADLASWVVDNAPVLDQEKPGEVVHRRRGRRERMTDPGDPHLSEDGWAAFRRTLADRVPMAGRPRPDLMSRRLRRLAGITGISATDVRILEIHAALPDQPGRGIGGRRRVHGREPKGSLQCTGFRAALFSRHVASRGRHAACPRGTAGAVGSRIGRR